MSKRWKKATLLRAGVATLVATAALVLWRYDAMLYHGGADAQHALASRLLAGHGDDDDRQRALVLLAAAADQGHGQAAYELARLRDGSSAGPVDRPGAVALLRRAAELGHRAAQVELAFLHFNGAGGAAKDMAMAAHWFTQAAAAGSVVAQCMMGDLYRTGLGGVARDDALALRWYAASATQDDRCAPKAQFELYVSYEAGRGVAPDLAKAMDWLRRAAEAGNPRAQYTLGRSYERGYGVPQDFQMARSWVKKSREGVSWHDDHEHSELKGSFPNWMSQSGALELWANR